MKTELEYSDEKSIEAIFNIMPNINVKEKFIINKIIIKENSALAIFDRIYESEMVNSPNHITMTVLPLLTQRLFYAWACTKLQIEYDPFKKELIKIWPSKLELIYPSLISTERDIKYSMEIDTFRKIEDKKYFVKGKSNISDKLFLNAEGIVLIL